MDWVLIYTDAARNAAQTLQVPLQWVLGVIGAESSFQAPAQTWEPAAAEYSYGPMQVLGSTARGLGFQGALGDLMAPETGIYWGTAYLRQLIDRYGFDFDSVISAYNRGHADKVAGAGYIARVTAWLGQLPADLAALAADASSNDSGAALALLAGAGVLYFSTRQKGRRYVRS